MRNNKASDHHLVRVRQTQSLPLGLICLLTLFIAAAITVPPAAFGEAKEVHTNRLIKSRDPYLLLHAHNPVDWYPWGPEALERARREDKPIFVSIGYSTCYWCHVAERELYSDPEIARLMNKWFVNIKVDREERPDLDRIYMLTTQILKGHGGWPNNLFLTPGLKPFFAGSYFPPRAVEGRPGFPDILKGLHEAWTGDRGRVDKVAGEVYRALREAEDKSVTASKDAPSIGRWLEKALSEASADFDKAEGGFVGGGGTKFPRSPRLNLLLRAYREGHHEEALKMVSDTLTAMATGGIMDQLGGGFHRYSTEPGWSIPHFEKMLYDNAQLLALYAGAYAITKRPLFRQVALRTAEYLKVGMQAPKGGFFSAEDAESGGIEGASYVWTRNEIESVLGAGPGRRFFALYDLVPMPEALAGHRQTPGGVLRLRREKSLRLARGNGLAAAISALTPMREKLLAIRGLRTQPARDEKIVIADNALAITGFSEAFKALREDWLRAVAINTGNWVWVNAYDEKTFEVRHQFFMGHPGGPGFLDDYALLGEAFMSLYHSTGDRLWLGRAKKIADSMLKRFTLPDGSLAASWDRSGLLAVSLESGDSARPSGKSAAIGLLLDLAAGAPEGPYAAAALTILAPLQERINARPYNWDSLLSSLERPAIRAALDSAVKAQSRVRVKDMADSAAHVHASVSQFPSHKSSNLILTVSVDAGYHINANPPSAPYLVATELLIEGYPGVKVDYPPSKTFKARFAPKGIAVYDGSITLKARLPQKTSNSIPAINLRVQACSESLCLAPALIKVPLKNATPPIKKGHGKGRNPFILVVLGRETKCRQEVPVVGPSVYKK